MERGTKTEEYQGTSQYIEVIPGWHNFVLKEPLKRGRKRSTSIHN